MDLEKIEMLVAKLAKDGDRETISVVCELLNEVSKFKKKGEKKSNLEEMLEVQKPKIPKETKSHAALILDGIPDTYVPNSIPQSNYSGGNSVSNFKPEITGHADLLL
jgi:hypothetical protein